MNTRRAQVKASHLQPLESHAEAVAALFEQHHGQLFRTAYRITGNAGDAEDVLQTVFLRLLRHGRLELSEGAAVYLRKAAVNAAVDVLRARRRTNLVALDELADELAGSAARRPDKQYDEKELRRQLRQAIARLGERAALVFVLRELEGYDNQEVAEMLNSSKLVVAVTLYRARARVRKEMRSLVEGNRHAQ